jgi:FAD/FMN-containing dehydrogenase
MEPLIAALTALLGPKHVIVDPPDLAGLARDGRGAFGRPLCAVRPATAALVADALRLCGDFSAVAVPRGAGTGLSGGGCADDSGSQVVILTDGLGGAIEIDAANRTATVGAGVRLSALNAAARDHGLFLPIDLGADPSIGGMIATNTGGARLLLHGDMRRHVRAIEVVLGDGEIVQLGSPLWKDNSALDIKQLCIGAGGATGIVTGATISLTPLPRHQVTAMLALADPRSAVDLLLSAERHFGTLLTAFEGLSIAAVEAALDHVPGLTSPFPHAQPGYIAMIELSGNAVCDTAALENALAEWCAPFLQEEGSVLDAVVDSGGRHWAIRHAIPEGIRHRGSVIACDIAVRRGDIMACRAHLLTEVAARWPDLTVHDFGHVGDGGLHFNLVWPHRLGSIPPGLAEAVRTCVFDITVRHYGGSFSAEHGVGPRNIGHYRRLIPASTQRLSARITEQFSAANTTFQQG